MLWALAWFICEAVLTDFHVLGDAVAGIALRLRGDANTLRMTLADHNALFYWPLP